MTDPKAAAFVAYAWYGIPFDEIIDLIFEDFPSAPLGDIHASVDLGWWKVREAVSGYARYVMAGVFGDDAEETLHEERLARVGDMDTVRAYLNDMKPETLVAYLPGDPDAEIPF